MFGHKFPPNMFAATAANRNRCQLNKKTPKQSLKQGSCATHVHCTWPILSGLVLTLMLTALGRVFSSSTPLLPLSLSPIATASFTASLSSSSSTARQLHLCFSQEPQFGQRIMATCRGRRWFRLFIPFPFRRFCLFTHMQGIVACSYIISLSLLQVC